MAYYIYRNGLISLNCRIDCGNEHIAKSWFCNRPLLHWSRISSLGSFQGRCEYFSFCINALYYSILSPMFIRRRVQCTIEHFVCFFHKFPFPLHFIFFYIELMYDSTDQSHWPISHTYTLSLSRSKENFFLQHSICSVFSLRSLWFFFISSVIERW